MDKKNADVAMQAPVTSIPLDVAGSLANARCYRSRDLFHSDNKIFIEHDSEIYRLNITQSGKLILTK